MVMSNYLSLGVDAKAALLWARLFKAAPYLFRLRLLNKLWYIVCGTPELLLRSYKDLHARCEIVCDGTPIKLPPNCEGIMILNTPSYGGGSDLWDEGRSAPLRARSRSLQTEELPASPDDGILEVVAVSDVTHLALSLGGISSGIRLCQGRHITLACREGGVPLQVDGEPFNIVPATPNGSEPFEVSLSLRGSSLMLASPAGGFANGGGGDSGALAVERAVAAGHISPVQRTGLFKEMSRATF